VFLGRLGLAELGISFGLGLGVRLGLVFVLMISYCFVRIVGTTPKIVTIPAVFGEMQLYI